MSGSVVLEVGDGAGGWVRVEPAVSEGVPGSISSECDESRDVFMFGIYGGEPGVWRSRFGVDAEVQDVRMITTTGMERVADLTEGPYEMDRTFRGVTRRVRFRWEP